MQRIFFLTDTYFPDRNGGAIICAGTVKYLEENGFNIEVITVDRERKEINKDNNITYIPINSNPKISLMLTRLGLKEDYLDNWSKSTILYLLSLDICSNDIIFAVTVGHLGCLKVGSILKQKTSCRLIMNFHDPIKYSLVGKFKYDNKFHVSREKSEAKYILNADIVITSSELYKNILEMKYPALRHKIFNNYFGFIKKASLFPKVRNPKIRIAYGGNFGWVQSPEVIAESVIDDNDFEVFFIGNYKQYYPLQKYKNVKNIHFINSLEHNEYLNFLMENIDIGFLSLSEEYFAACVPSKLYEYINLGIPVLAALPDGDAKNIINKNKYGIAVNFDIDNVKQALRNFKKSGTIDIFHKNIMHDRENWDMKIRIGEVVELINDLKKE